MDFEWDAAKARSNLSKHGVAFEDAAFVWFDPSLLVRFDRIVDYEERWWAIGYASPGGLLVVVHLYPDPDNEGLVWIISARKANRHEKQEYRDGSV